MNNIASGYRAATIHSTIGLKIHGLRQQCQPHQKIAVINGIPTIVNKTRLDRMIGYIFNK